MRSSYFLAGLFGILLLSGIGFSTIVMLNSLDYEDIVAGNVYAKANGYNFVFALTPNQSVFITKYYTSYSTEKIIYIEGKRPVLPNMEAILREGGKRDIEVATPDSVPKWVAEKFPKQSAIIVGTQYGQDALSVAPYAALTQSPVLFIGGSNSYEDILGFVKGQGYQKVMFYGTVANQIPPTALDSVQNKDVINTGSRYDNNLKIVSEFLKISPTTQVIFVSGRTFEKSMVDKAYPIILMGRSDVSSDTTAFLSQNKILTGIVFAGDADIVDGVTKIRNQYKNLSVFAKFGEGYLGSAQPLPLTIIPLPSPSINLEIVNISYNVPSKLFEVRVNNKGDFTALSGSINVPNIGSADSPLVYLDSNSLTTVAIPMDASAAISGSKIPQATLTVRYGEDSRLLDNIDSINYADIGVSQYSDNSSVSVIGFSYNADTKSFELVLDGSGYVEGIVRFSINQVPYTIRIPNTKIDGATTVSVKYLLSDAEQSFVNGLRADYSLRFGGKSDILLKESKGSLSTTVKAKPAISLGAPEKGGAAQGDGGQLLLIIGAVVLIMAVAFVFFRSRGSGSEFD